MDAKELLDEAGCTRKPDCVCEFCGHSAEIDRRYDERHERRDEATAFELPEPPRQRTLF